MSRSGWLERVLSHSNQDAYSSIGVINLELQKSEQIIPKFYEVTLEELVCHQVGTTQRLNITQEDLHKCGSDIGLDSTLISAPAIPGIRMIYCFLYINGQLHTADLTELPDSSSDRLMFRQIPIPPFYEQG